MPTNLRLYVDVLKKHTLSPAPGPHDYESILELLYDAYSEVHRLDNDEIKSNFHALYNAMNGISLRDMDQILDPVCTLCRSHERSGFIEGIKIGIRLAEELSEDINTAV